MKTRVHSDLHATNIHQKKRYIKVLGDEGEVGYTLHR